MALAQKAKHSISVPTVALAIDILNTITDTRKEVPKSMEPNINNTTTKHIPQNTAAQEKCSQKNTYKNIQIQIKEKKAKQPANKNLHAGPQKITQKERCLHTACKGKNQKRKSGNNKTPTSKKERK